MLSDGHDGASVKTHLAQTEEEAALSRRLRHELFCEGGAGQVLETCTAPEPGSRHDEYDRFSLFFWGEAGGVPVATARLILGPDLQSARALRGMGPAFADLLPGRMQRRIYRLFARLHLPTGLLLRLWLRRWAEPSRLGLMAEYQHSPAGREIVLGILGRITESAMARGLEECLITMRPGVWGIISWMPLRVGPLFAYPNSRGGPVTDDPIRAVSVNLREVVAAAYWHTNPEIFRLMFGDGSGVPPVDPSKVRTAEAMTVQAKRNRKLHSAQMRAVREGRLALATFG